MEQSERSIWRALFVTNGAAASATRRKNRFLPAYTTIFVPDLLRLSRSRETVFITTGTGSGIRATAKSETRRSMKLTSRAGDWAPAFQVRFPQWAAFYVRRRSGDAKYAERHVLLRERRRQAQTDGAGSPPLDYESRSR